MKILFILSLVNSIGANALWLSAGPHIESNVQGLGFIGVLAAVRQVSFLLGAIYGGIQADKGYPLRKYFIFEVLIILSSLYLCALGDKSSGWHFLSWAFIRFFLSGITSNLSFKIFGGVLKNWSWGNTASMLFIQGSFFFSSILAFSFPFIESNYFELAIIVDIATSVFLLIFLIYKHGGELDLNYSTPKRSLINDLKDAAFSCWSKGLRNLSVIRSLLLVSTGGALVFSMQLSKVYLPENSKNIFYLFFLIYGFNAWVAALILKKMNNNHLALKLSLWLIIGSCLLFIPLSFSTFMLAIFAFTLSFWIGILSSNQLILAEATSENSGKLSSSLIFQISVIYGITEIFYGYLAESINLNVVLSIRIIIAIIAICLCNKKRSHA